MTLADLETTHAYDSDEENTAFMLFLPNPTLEETKQFLIQTAEEWKKADPDFYEFAIVLEGQHIGAVSLYLDETKETGELGWIINKRYWKRGIASEAALAVKDFAINTLKLKKLLAYCDYRNIASYTVMEKLGLRLESDSGERTYTKRKETVKELTYSLRISR